MAAGRKDAGGRDGGKTGKGNAGMAEATFGSRLKLIRNLGEPTQIETHPWGTDYN